MADMVRQRFEWIALMTDVIQGGISPEIANAATNAGRALVRMVELEYKMATSNGKKSGRGMLISRRVEGDA